MLLFVVGMPFANKLLSSLDWVFHICGPPSNSILDMLLKAIMDIYLQESDVSTCQVSDVLANDRCERVGVLLSGLVFCCWGGRVFSPDLYRYILVCPSCAKGLWT